MDAPTGDAPPAAAVILEDGISSTYGVGPGWVPLRRSSLIPKEAYLALVKARDARSAAAQTGASGSDGAGGGGGVGGSSEEAVHTGKRKRGQNKGRSAEDIGLGSAPVPRLCRWALPGAAQPCPFGERCRDEHSLAAFFAAKPVDLEGVCPVFSALGVCASGPSCRWALSHTDPGTGAQHSPASATGAGVAGNFERNAMPLSLIHISEPTRPY